MGAICAEIMLVGAVFSLFEENDIHNTAALGLISLDIFSKISCLDIHKGNLKHLARCMEKSCKPYLAKNLWMA